MIPCVLLSWVPSTKKTIDFELSEVHSTKNYPQSIAFFFTRLKVGENRRSMKGSYVES